MSLAAWSGSFVDGALAAVAGSIRALADPSLRQVFWRSAKQLFAWSVVLIVLVHVLLLPVEWALSLLLPAAWIDASVRALRYAMVSTVPFVVVTGSRYLNVALFEDAFFAGLSARDKELATRIRQREAIYWDMEYFRHAIVAGARQGAFGLLVVLVSPLLGILVPIFRFGYKTRRMEKLFWVPIVLAFCFPWTRAIAVRIVGVWINSRELTRELYDPVIARLKSPGASTSHTHAYEWHTDRSEAARLGFSMVIGFLLEVPFLGPFTWFAAFVAAGLRTPELINVDGLRTPELINVDGFQKKQK